MLPAYGSLLAVRVLRQLLLILILLLILLRLLLLVGTKGCFRPLGALPWTSLWIGNTNS